MSVRARVAVALIVAAVVPLIGVFAIAGVLLPLSVGQQERLRLDEGATAATSLLARDCQGVGDRASVVVSRLQVEVSVADVDVLPGRVLAEQAQDVVNRVQEVWTIVVLDRSGNPVAQVGPLADEVAADPRSYLDRSCGTGRLGEPAALVRSVPVQAEGGRELGTVIVASPLDEAAMTELAGSVALEKGGLVLLQDDRVLATTRGLGLEATEATGATADRSDGSDGSDGSRATGSAEPAEPTVPAGSTEPAAAAAPPLEGAVDLTALLREVDGARPDQDGVRGGSVGDRRLAVAGPVLGSSVQAVALGEPRPPVDRRLALAFVVTAFGTAALVWFLSSTLTRPLTELAELARRIAAGEDLAAASPEAVSDDADADVQGVSAVLGSLARDLRASEADAQRRRGAFLDAFSRFGDALQQTHDRDGLLQTVLQAALLAAEAPMGLALHHDRSSRLPRRELSLRARSRGDGPDQLEDAVRRRLSLVAERALAERGVVEVPGDDELGPVLAVPLGSSSRPLGAVVVARDPGAPGYDAVAFEAIGALAGNAGTALANIKEHQEVERLSVTDPLTGVNNFRHLSTMLARELERAARFGHPLGVLMLDIDRFKPVNDTHGHAAGDAVLRELARRVKECVREVDTVARYGGEEFALLLPETDLDGSARLAERVLAAIRSEVFHLPEGPDLVITASMGVACFPASGSTATDVMRAADEALYRAKAGGRDRVVVAGAEPVARSGAALGSPDDDVSP